MIKKIIVLCGPGNAGKTNTLKSFADDLVRSGAQVVWNGASPQNSNDVVLILEYHGQIICISSYGDDAKGVEYGYDKAVQNDSDVFITASHIADKCKSLQYIKDVAGQIGVSPIYVGAIRESTVNLQKKSVLRRLRNLWVLLGSV